MRNFTSVDDARTWLRTIGAVGQIRGGIQVDVNVAFRNAEGALREASLCDHSCTTEGGNYDCPAAFSLPGNRGLKKSTMAPADVLANWIITASIGLSQAISDFLEVQFDYFCQTSGIANLMVKQALWLMLIGGKIEVNLFGGNPEMHPEIAHLIRLLKEHGLIVNLTTTGRRWLADPTFAKSLVGIEPSVLALSLDDLEPAALYRLSAMTTDQIRNEWRQINPLHGQKQKAHEAVAVLRHYQEAGGYPHTTLFNMVLHTGNLERVDEMFKAVEKCAPGTRLNPYADQTAFAGQPGSFGLAQQRQFERFVDRMIKQSADPAAHIVKRLPHWLLDKAVFKYYGGDVPRIGNAIGGDGVWRCYNALGAGFYIQIGRSPSAVSAVHPGGHLGCYWNPDTVTQASQIENYEQVQLYVTYGMAELARQAITPCLGCRMPRLDSVHLVVLERGIVDDGVLKIYRNLRREHAGF